MTRVKSQTSLTFRKNDAGIVEVFIPVDEPVGDHEIIYGKKVRMKDLVEFRSLSRSE